MSFLLAKTINPHLLLHALSLPPNHQRSSTHKQRLYLLAKTRQFDNIAAAAEPAKDAQFPSLKQKLAKAKAKSQAEKAKLGFERYGQILKELDDMSKEEDPNFEKIDDGQAQMFDLAKILFEEGHYQKSLQIVKDLQKQDVKEEMWLKITWARLYCQILLNLDSLKTLQSLKKKIEDIQTQELAFNAQQKIKNDKLIKRLYAQKQEFLILSLFISFLRAGDEQMQKFVDSCTNQKSYFSILQLTCPQLLRYLIVAITLNKTLQNNRQFDLFKLAQVINRKYIKYTDPFTNFISLVEVEYNFEEVKQQIQKCKEVIRDDIFLVKHQERIIEGLHFLYFKRVCKVYQVIQLKQITEFTGLSKEEAELWILGYIRTGDIDAKIDSISQLVLTNKGRHTVSQKYVDVIPDIGSLVTSLSRAIVPQ